MLRPPQAAGALAPGGEEMTLEGGTRLGSYQVVELIGTSAANLPFWVDLYDVTADGQRFLVNTALEESAAAPITVVENWAAGLKR